VNIKDKEKVVVGYAEELGKELSSTSVKDYLFYVKRWLNYIDGQLPTPENAQAFLVLLTEQGKTTAVARVALKRFLWWQSHGNFLPKAPKPTTPVSYPGIVISGDFLCQNAGLLVPDKSFTLLKANSAWGKRPKTEDCELCGKNGHDLNYHHWDNAHPWYGMWICDSCHRKAESVEHLNTFLEGNRKFMAEYLLLKDMIERGYRAKPSAIAYEDEWALEEV